jgi:hypothetical protein
MSWRRDRRETADERGSTFVATLLLSFAILGLAVSALVGASAGLRIATNYRTGAQALLAAEAGAVHAQKRISDYGIVRFDTDVVDAWESLFGTSERAIPGAATVRYTVSVADDPNDPARYALLTASGSAPGESRRAVQLRLERTGTFSPGAIYLPDPNVSTRFEGNSFLIDGNDTRLDGRPSGKPPIPAIGTATDAAARNVRGSLSPTQYDNVIGRGPDPSVLASAGPEVERLQNEIVSRILSRPGVVENPRLSGNDTFGTLASPQITHFTGTVDIAGNLSGVGILIVDQGLRISGNVEFTGLIIVRGATEITTVTGNATVLGAIWTSDLELRVSGTASVTYSSEALELANRIDPGEALLPQRVRAVSWNQL